MINIKKNMENKEKNTQYKAHTAKIRILVSIMFIVILMNFSSALEFDNFKIIGQKGGAGYPNIKIKNAFGLGSTLWDGELTKNTKICGSSCNAEQKITMDVEGSLIDDIRFYTLEGNKKYLQDIRSYKIYYRKPGMLKDVNEYESVCEKVLNKINGTMDNVCSKVVVGSHKEESFEWIELELGEKFDSGTYEIKLVGNKKPSRTVDWQIKTNGIWTTEWAVWGNISDGDDAEVILNNPVDDYIALINNVEFNASANITGGSYLTNISLWTNETGVWELRNLTEFPGTEESIAEESTNPDVSVGDDIYGVNWGLQSFNSSQLFLLNKISLFIGVVGSPPDYSVSIKTFDGSNPTGNVLSTGTLSSPTTGAWNNITMSSVSLDSNTDYAIILNSTTADISNRLIWMNKENDYIDGKGYRSTNNGSSWVENANDYYFYVFGSPLTLSTTQTWNRTITEDIVWNVQACDSDGDCGFAIENRTLTIDTTAPTVELNYGNGTIDYGNLEINHTINFTVTDDNLDSCWVQYNETNQSVSCSSGVETSVNFTLQNNLYNATIYANDTIGNIQTEIVEWDYKLFEVEDYFNPSTVSGATNPFNITFQSNSQITTAYLNYNGTNILGSINSTGNTYYLNKNQIAPGVEELTNISFFWAIGRSDGFSYNTTSQEQEISPIIINETCGSGMYVIRNFTLVDENTQDTLNGVGENTSIKIDLSLYTEDRTLEISSFEKDFNSTNPATICIDSNLSGGEKYSLDIQVQYGATNYSTELYNIENFTLDSDTLNINTTLYDLLNDNSQNFKIIARDSSYLPIEGALVQIERKYIDEGLFKITEIPKTDEKGITSASLEVEDIIYNFYVYDGKELISSFTNVLAICQNPLVKECLIELNAFATGINITDYGVGDDFEFDIEYNSTSRTISTTFEIPSGEPSEIKLEIIREDTLGTVINSSTLSSASGTISMEIPSSFGNSTVLAKVYKTNIEQGRGQIKLNQSSSDIFGVILVILSVLVMMTLIGLAISNNPVISVVFIFVGVILLYGMNLVQNTGFIGATATILFFGIAVILVIIKAARRT